MRFGGLVAVNELDLSIEPGALYGLIGPNGAGKTTVFNVITGVYDPSQGQVVLDGQAISGLKPHGITARGVARTFQNIRLFPNMSVVDNVKVAFHLRQEAGVFAGLAHSTLHHREEARVDTEARELLSIFKLQDLAGERAKNLAY